jgi:hypothetical protein
MHCCSCVYCTLVPAYLSASDCRSASFSSLMMDGCYVQYQIPRHIQYVPARARLGQFFASFFPAFRSVRYWETRREICLIRNSRSQGERHAWRGEWTRCLSRHCLPTPSLSSSLPPPPPPPPHSDSASDHVMHPDLPSRSETATISLQQLGTNPQALIPLCAEPRIILLPLGLSLETHNPKAPRILQCEL